MLASSNRVNTDKVAHSLKGLLMDKGVGSCEVKLQNILNKIFSVQAAMIELVALQKASNETNQCECMALYLAVDLKSDSGKKRQKPTLNIAKITPFDTKRAPILEWRTRSDFATCYGLSPTARLSAFNTQHEHYEMVKAYVSSRAPNYYHVLGSYETVRVSLNCALKALRRIALDISAVKAESEGMSEATFECETHSLSRRIVQEIDLNKDIGSILSGLYL